MRRVSLSWNEIKTRQRPSRGLPSRAFPPLPQTTRPATHAPPPNRAAPATHRKAVPKAAPPFAPTDREQTAAVRSAFPNSPNQPATRTRRFYARFTYPPLPLI